MLLPTPWLHLAALFATLGHVFAQVSASKSQVSYQEDDLLDNLTPVPTGAPQNDPWALPLIDGCPRNCVEAGPDTANWTQLYDQTHLSLCKYPLLFALNIHNSASRYSTIRVCALNTSGNGKRSTTAVVAPHNESNASPGTIKLSLSSSAKCGAGESTTKTTVMAGPAALPDNVRSDAILAANSLFSYLESNTACGNTILFAKSGVAVVGLYAGADLKKDRAAELLRKYCLCCLGMLSSFLVPAIDSGSLALEICDNTTKASNTIGIFASEGESIGRVQEALRKWAIGECLPNQGMRLVEKSVQLGILLSNDQTNISNYNSFEGKQSRRSLSHLLIWRSECRAIRVDDGDSCASLASRCGISGAQFTEYNSDSKLAELKRATLSPDGMGTTPTLRLSSHVVDVDLVTKTVTCSNGKSYTGDIIVAADGIRSATGASVFGELPVKSDGFSAYRCMIPTSRMRNNPDTAILVDSAKVLIFVGPDRRIVAYPCSSWETMNFVCIFPDDRKLQHQWNSKVSVEEMVDRFKDFHPSVGAFLSMASNTGVWQLLDREPLSTYIKGSFAMIGDAAHAMGPHQGQGACQAIEDAEALRVILKGAKREEVEGRLMIYDELRVERANQIIRNTRDMAPRRAESENVDHRTTQTYADYHWSYKITQEAVALMNKQGYPIVVADVATADISLV